MEVVLIDVPVAKARSICEDLRVVREAISWAKENPQNQLSLDDAWAALHFTLTAEYPIPRQKAEELGLSWDEDSLENVIMGGAETPFPSSFGPTRYLSPALVRSMSANLAKIDVSQFSTRVDPKALSAEKMLPDSWDPETAAQLLPAYFAKLKAFYSEAASNGDGVLIYFKD